MRSRRAAVAAAAALTTLLAGCGGSSTLSQADYRKAALRAGESEVAFNRSLPQLALTSHLTIAQLQQRAKQHAARYLATVRALHPPSGLKADHDRLVRDLSNTPPDGSGAVVVIAHNRRIANDLTALGLKPCADAVRQSIASLQRAASQQQATGP